MDDQPHVESLGHDRPHDHAPGYFGRAFAIGIALNLGFVGVEAIFGFIANSMALLSDAGHNLSDVLGLVVAWVGGALALKGASPRFTYGLKKASILAALANALFLMIATGAIGAEAIRRLLHPSPTEGAIVMIVAAVGIVVNGLTAALFARGRKDDINVRAAFSHMAADALIALSVMFAGLLILLTHQLWIDPVMSLIVSVVIVWGTFGLFKESVLLSLAGVPKAIDVDEVEFALAEMAGVDAVHDLHIWPLSTTETALTAHIVTAQADYPDSLIERARHLLHSRFRIEHCTIQVERHHADHHSNC